MFILLVHCFSIIYYWSYLVMIFFCGRNWHRTQLPRDSRHPCLLPQMQMKKWPPSLIAYCNELDLCQHQVIFIYMKSLILSNGVLVVIFIPENHQKQWLFQIVNRFSLPVLTLQLWKVQMLIIYPVAVQFRNSWNPEDLPLASDHIVFRQHNRLKRTPSWMRTFHRTVTERPSFHICSG